MTEAETTALTEAVFDAALAAVPAPGESPLVPLALVLVFADTDPGGGSGFRGRSVDLGDLLERADGTAVSEMERGRLIAQHLRDAADMMEARLAGS